MVIEGAIDLVVASSGSFTVSGWSCAIVEGIVVPVDSFSLSLDLEIEIERTERSIRGVPSCGFAFTLDSVDLLAQLYWGASTLIATHRSGGSSIGFWEKINSKVERIIADALHSRYLSEQKDTESDRLLPSLYLKAKPNLNVRPSAFGLAASNLNPGALTTDQEVIVGHSGHLFLVNGSNNLLDQYSDRNEPVTIGWGNLLERRAHSLEEAGVQYLQLIIPEKQSVLPEFFPIEIDVPTNVLKALSRSYESQKWYIDAFSSLRKLFSTGGCHPFRKLDSHLSLFGAHALVDYMLARIDSSVEVERPPLVSFSSSGDLGQKILEDGLLERFLVSADDWSLAKNTPVLVKQRVPADGHIGVLLEWKLDRPLSRCSILIFGNSMFERGGSSLSLTWWFARIFERVRFVWSPSVDYSMVKEFQPDVVICQTVERFLPTVPAD